MSHDGNIDQAKNGDQWDACSPGELTKMVHRLDARDRSARRKQVLNTALLSTALFAGLVLVLSSFMGQGGAHYGNIACSVCREHMSDYQLHLVGKATLEDADLLASMKVHLDKCKFCKSRFNTMYPEQRIADLTATRPALLVATQPSLSLYQPSELY